REGRGAGICRAWSGGSTSSVAPGGTVSSMLHSWLSGGLESGRVNRFPFFVGNPLPRPGIQPGRRRNMGEQSPARGPDFSLGLASAEIADGASLAGRVGDQPAILSRRGDDFFAVSGSCTHYGGLLADGLIESDRVHCPLHHACFSLRTGEALAAPAFDA